MIRLNKKQTKAVERLFKKMDLLSIGFEETEEEGTVQIYITDWSGRSVGIFLGENGIAQKVTDASLEL